MGLALTGAVTALYSASGAGCTPVDRKLGELSSAASDETGGTGGTGGQLALAGVGGVGAAEGGSARVNAAVWGNSLGDVWTAGFTLTDVGDAGNGFVAQLIGGSGRVEHEAPQALRGLWGYEPASLLAVGALVVTNQGGWQNTRLPPGIEALTAAWGPDATEVFAVGQRGASARGTPQSWQVEPTGTTEDLNAVWGASRADVFAVGDGGTILRFDGEAWSALNSGTTEDLMGVWGTSAQDVYAVGGSAVTGSSIVLHYDGDAWEVVAAGDRGPLRAVHGDAAGAVVAVGGYRLGATTHALVLRRGTSGFTEVETPVGARLWDVWVGAHTHAVAVGEGDTVVRFEASASGDAHVVPAGVAACGGDTVPLVALPILEAQACIDTVAPVIAACAEVGVPADSGYRCVRHAPSGVRFVTRAPATALDPLTWSSCSLPEPLGACQSRPCARPLPQLYCSPSAACSVLGCGAGALDSRGCLRPTCDDATACAPTETCLEVTVPSYTLCAQDVPGACSCSNLDHSTKERHCVPTP